MRDLWETTADTAVKAVDWIKEQLFRSEAGKAVEAFNQCARDISVDAVPQDHPSRGLVEAFHKTGLTHTSVAGQTIATNDLPTRCKLHNPQPD